MTIPPRDPAAAAILRDTDTFARLHGVRLCREIGPHRAKILARQGLTTFADVAALTDDALLRYRTLGPETVIRLRRATDRLIAGRSLISEQGPVHPWDRLDSYDPRQDLLIDPVSLSPDQTATLRSTELDRAGLSADALFIARLFACTTLLDVASLSPALIGSLSPATFADLRAGLIRALDDGRPSAPPQPVITADPPAYAPPGPPIPETLIVPPILRGRLRRIGLCALIQADQTYEALTADGITDACALVARDPQALADRYGLSRDDLCHLNAAILGALGPKIRQALNRSGDIAWIGRPPHAGHSTRTARIHKPWIALTPAERRRLQERDIQPGQAGLTPRLAEHAIAGGYRTLADLADLPADRMPTLLSTAEATCDALRARLVALAQHADPVSSAKGIDIDALRQDGFGPDLCTALALAGFPTLGCAARADLATIPGIPAEIASGVKQAIHARLDLRSRTENAAILSQASAEQIAWLKTQPIAALDAPRLRKGVIHRLRRAGFCDLAGLAACPPAQLPRLPSLGDLAAGLIAARLVAILAETPLASKPGRSTSKAA